MGYEGEDVQYNDFRDDIALVKKETTKWSISTDGITVQTFYCNVDGVEYVRPFAEDKLIALSEQVRQLTCSDEFFRDNLEANIQAVRKNFRLNKIDTECIYAKSDSRSRQGEWEEEEEEEEEKHDEYSMYVEFARKVELAFCIKERVIALEKIGIPAQFESMTQREIMETLVQIPFSGNPFERFSDENFSFLTPDIVTRIGRSVIDEHDNASHYMLLHYFRRLTNNASCAHLTALQSRQDYLAKTPQPKKFLDAFHIGRSYIEYIAKNKADSISGNSATFVALTEESYTVLRDFNTSVDHLFKTGNLFVIGVPKPSNCYHMIMPTHRALLGSRITGPPKRTHIIWANTSQEFQHKIEKLTNEQSGKDPTNTRFILHPENMNERDIYLLRNFIRQRASDCKNTRVPCVVVITSLPMNLLLEERHNNRYLRMDEKDVANCCSVSCQFQKWMLGTSKVSVAYSKSSGSGKTRYAEIQLGGDHVEVYLDSEMKEIPNITGKSKIHFEMSPELFGNHFSLFDQFYELLTYGSYLRSDGEMVTLDGTNQIIMEVPCDDRVKDLEYYDFPIALENESFVTDFPRMAPKVISDPNTKAYLGYIFGETGMENYVDLMNKVSECFFGMKLKESSLADQRLIVYATRYLEGMISMLPPIGDVDSRSYGILCFLILRSLFTVLPGLCPVDETEGVKAVDSRIVVLPQRIFTGSHKESKWILALWKAPSQKDLPDYSFELQNDFIKVTEGCRIDNIYLLVEDMKKKSQFMVIDNDSMSADCMTAILKTFSYLDFTEESDDVMMLIRAKLLADISQNSHLFPVGEFRQIIQAVDNNDHAYFRKGWTSMHDFLKLYMDKDPKIRRCTTVNSMMIYLMGKIGKDQRANEIASMCLSVNSTILLMSTISKIVFRIFEILQGNTGLGKSKSITFLCKLMEFFGEQEGTPWKSVVIDFHGGITAQEVNAKISKDSYTFVVLDEVNTSEVGNATISKALNQLAGQSGASFIGIINQHHKMDDVERQLIRCGIPQVIPKKISGIRICSVTNIGHGDQIYTEEDRAKLAYNVLDIPLAAKRFITSVEPRPQKQDDDIMMTDEERNIISVRVNYSIQKWVASMTDKDLRDNITLKMSEIREELRKRICNVFQMVRTITNMRAVVSYRDVVRVVEVFITAFTNMIKNDTNRPAEIVINDAIMPAVKVAMFLGLALRFPDRTTVHFANDAEREKCQSRIRKVSKVTIRSDQVFNLRNMVISAWESEKWENEALKFSYLVAYKYIEGKYGVIRFPSLMYHLALMVCTEECFLRDGEAAAMSVLLVGDPGTSKTLAGNLYKQYNELSLARNTDDADSRKFRMTMFLSSRASGADSLVDQFNECSQFYLMNESKGNKPLVVVFLDEIGLANLNKSYPLKVMHSIQDKGNIVLITDGKTKPVRAMIIETSNYALDLAIQNRGHLHCCSIPDDPTLVTHFELAQPRHQAVVDRVFAVCSEEKPYLVAAEWKDFNPMEITVPGIDEDRTRGIINHIWSVCGGTRPRVVPMRPFYELINYVRKLANTSVSDMDPVRDIAQLNVLTTPFLRANDTIKTVIDLNAKLYRQLRPGSEPPSVPVMEILYRAITDQLCKNKSVLIRTKGYAADNFFDIIRMGLDEWRSKKGMDAVEWDHIRIFPASDDHASVAVENAYEQIITAVESVKPGEKIKVIGVVGNAAISDYILDLLNVNHPENDEWKPTVICRGYPVKLSKVPENLKFVFILNDDEVHNYDTPNPVPLPLLDRLIHIYIDPQQMEDELKKVKVKPSNTLVEKHLECLRRDQESDYAVIAKYVASQNTDDTIIKNRFDDERHDTIDGFFKYVKTVSETDKCPVRTVVMFTRTGPMETTVFEDESHGKYRVINDAEFQDMERLIVQIQMNEKDGKKRLLGGKDKNRQTDESEWLVVRSNNYLTRNERALINDRKLRNIVARLANRWNFSYALIIYSLADNEIPAGVKSAPGCMVYWFEDCGVNQLSALKMRTIATALKRGEVSWGDGNMLSLVLRRLIEKTEDDVNHIRDDKNQQSILHKGLGNLKFDEVVKIIYDMIEQEKIISESANVKNLVEIMLKNPEMNIKESFFPALLDCLSERYTYAIRLIVLRKQVFERKKKEALESMFKFVKENWEMIKETSIQEQELPFAQLRATWLFELAYPVLHDATDTNTGSRLKWKEYIRRYDENFKSVVIMNDVSKAPGFEYLAKVCTSSTVISLEDATKDILLWRGSRKELAMTDITDSQEQKLPKLSIDLDLFTGPNCHMTIDSLLLNDIDSGAVKSKSVEMIPHPMRVALELLDGKTYTFKDMWVKELTNNTTLSILSKYIMYMRSVREGEEGNEKIDSVIASVEKCWEFQSTDRTHLAPFIDELRPLVTAMRIETNTMNDDDVQKYSWTPECADPDLDNQFRNALQKLDNRRNPYSEYPSTLAEGTSGIRLLRQWLTGKVYKKEIGDWLFDPRENLLVRQLIVLSLEFLFNPSSFSTHFKIFCCFVDTWNQGNDDIGNSLWRVFQKKMVAGNHESNDFVECISHAACAALDELNSAIQVFRPVRPFVLEVSGSNRTVKYNAQGCPYQIDCIIYSMIMYRNEIDKDSADKFRREFSFLKSLPHLYRTKYLPTIAKFTNVIFESFEQQLNIAYLLLKLSSSCMEIIEVEYEGFFATFYEKLAELKEDLGDAFAFIDTRYSHLLSAFERISAYVRDSVDIHNGAVINQKHMSCAFRLVDSNGSLANVSFDNTIIPIMVIGELKSEDPLDPGNIDAALEMIYNPSRGATCNLFGTNGYVTYTILHECRESFMGIPEADFISSLRAADRKLRFPCMQSYEPGQSSSDTSALTIEDKLVICAMYEEAGTEMMSNVPPKGRKLSSARMTLHFLQHDSNAIELGLEGHILKGREWAKAHGIY